MKDRKGQYIFVAVLLLLVATLSICYAVFFDKEDEQKTEAVVKITGVVANETQGGKNVTMTFDSNSINFEEELEHAGAYVVYDVTIENSKEEKVALKEILGVDTANNQDPKAVTFEVIGIQTGDIIDAKTKKVVKIKASRAEGEINTLEVLKKQAKITFTFE
jgi:hypothetical protein